MPGRDGKILRDHRQDGNGENSIGYKLKKKKKNEHEVKLCRVLLFYTDDNRE